MADTRYLTKHVEEHVRGALADQYGQPFTKERLTLTSGGHHEFDAVSADRSVIASVKSASGRTSGGNHPTGKVMACIAEMYFLTLVEAPVRAIVLTSAEMHEILVKTLRGRIAPGLSVVHIPLPDAIQTLASEVHGQASAEMSSVLDPVETAALQQAVTDVD